MQFGFTFAFWTAASLVSQCKAKARGCEAAAASQPKHKCARTLTRWDIKRWHGGKKKMHHHKQMEAWDAQLSLSLSSSIQGSLAKVQYVLLSRGREVWKLSVAIWCCLCSLHMETDGTGTESPAGTLILWHVGPQDERMVKLICSSLHRMAFPSRSLVYS